MQTEAHNKMLRWAHLPECEKPARGWSVKPFREIAEVIAGQSPPSDTYNDKGDGLPFLQGNADFSLKHPIPTSWCSSPAKTAKAGDTLISVRAPVGELNRADRDYAIGRGLAAVRATDSNPDFIYHALQRWRWCLQRVAQGTTFDAVTARHFAQLHVAVPCDPDEQAAIAWMLDAVDIALERNRSAIARARELDHSLLHDLLEKGLGPNRYGKRKRPAHWKLQRVDEVAEVGSGVTLGKDVSGFKSVELPYLRVANVQDGHLDLSEIKTVRVRVGEVENFRLETGDVLMTEGGDLDKLGRGTIWEGQIQNCLHQNHTFRIRANRDLLVPEFFSLVVESDIAKRYFNRVAKRTTNLASTNKTQVRAFQFPLPPTTDEQQQIAAIMKAAKAKLAALVRKEQALTELKKSLMHDLLTGRVRVPIEQTSSATRNATFDKSETTGQLSPLPA
jgi:type I restriction enzyme S subunit